MKTVDLRDYSKPRRARDLGIALEGSPGEHNAITDVSGVEVGLKTLIFGEGKHTPGAGPVRTGVTAIFPRGRHAKSSVFAGCSVLNGAGELTGSLWLKESGFLEGPILLTNTHSVGAVQAAALKWRINHKLLHDTWYLPVVMETYDGYLNDINGFHVKETDVFDALSGASSGPVLEGNVGGGTGAICFQFKGGTGTSSRICPLGSTKYVVGALVQANFGTRNQLRMGGVPVGKILSLECRHLSESAPTEAGSLLAILATDAPLLPHQLERLAHRAALGMARTGGTAGNGSGDIFLAVSTAPLHFSGSKGSTFQVSMLPNSLLTPLFEAAVEGVEEAILNALISAETMTGLNGRCVAALPHFEVEEIMRERGYLIGADKRIPLVN